MFFQKKRKKLKTHLGSHRDEIRNCKAGSKKRKRLEEDDRQDSNPKKGRSAKKSKKTK